VLLRALGMTTEDLLNYYYRKDTIILDGRKAAKRFQPDHLVGIKASRDLRNPSTNELIVKEGRKFTKAALRQMEQAASSRFPIALEEVLGRVAAHDVKDPKTGEVVLATQRRDHGREARAAPPARHQQDRGSLPRRHAHRAVAAEHALQDKIEKPEDAILEIYRRLRPGDPPDPETPPRSSTTSSSTPSATTSRASGA
jgi:DNA-directed RNA polymerase subunit beta